MHCKNRLIRMGLRDFDPQQVGCRLKAGEKPACRRGGTLFSAGDSKGLPIPDNSNVAVSSGTRGDDDLALGAAGRRPRRGQRGSVDGRMGA
jgi:hypothetical protein